MAGINIYHLYPEHLNLYGDRGNILALCRRAEWYGLPYTLVHVRPGEKIDFARCDLLFMGGGQDYEQRLVAGDLKRHRSELLAAIEQGMVILAVCGSYQLLGRYYTTGKGDSIPGLDILDLYTKSGHKRMIGNIVTQSRLWEPPRTLAGFENHAGRTYLGPSVKPLGKVVHGFGNNGEDKSEGAVYNNVIGTYLHGALLPKNPWLADHLLRKAVSYRRQQFLFKPLDDKIELNAHRSALRLTGSRRHKLRSSRV
ncbi:MAG: glutamine amidotransferase [Dethiobacter sp.]|jgi:CobQ-like glutamine amidotransferase family enzyme|nr:glutamine amidotransferase [Dethiobacter sp.]